MKDLSGKVAVVTGGAGGIGRAMAERFLTEGMRVVLADFDQAPLDDAVESLQSGSREVIGLLADVTKRESMEQLRAATLEQFGAVHVLCNNAGVANTGVGQIWEHEDVDWRWSLDVHLFGVIHGCAAFIPSMLEHGEEGHIVNTSSGNGGLTPFPSTPTYAVAKAAVVTYTECLWAQLRSTRIGVSVLFPTGYTPGLLNTGIWNQRDRPPEYATATPRPPRRGLDEWVKRAEQEGRSVQFTPLDEVADQVVTGIVQDQFWMHVPREDADARVRERVDSLIGNLPPEYLMTGPG
ncbi:MAG TPA: SDR family NAD(P)-dependent oxidoreductase [Acidimicrobiales bacterium]|nr:SDR family NAD(P)-dependent oxidoreductase [Acidimicrobiales bacterium]